AILPQHLANQAMLESEAYMTYSAYATGKRITNLAKGDKPTKKKQSASKSNGLTVLSKFALTEAQQMKIAIERRKIQTHSSHASGSGDGFDIQSKVPDEQQQNISGINEGAGEDDEDNDEHDSENNNDDKDDDQENFSGETGSDNDGDDVVHPNLSTYKADNQEEEKEEETTNDDEEVSSDQMVSTPPDYEITEEEENQEDDDDVMRGEQEKEEDEELYRDLNLNLDRKDAEMTNAQNNQETEEVHVTLTTEPLVVQQQSSYVSSDLVSKFINPSSDTCIDSILNPNVQSDIHVNVSVSTTTETPSSDTTIPQLPIPIIQPQQQTHDSTTTTTLPEIPNFASLFDKDLFASYGDVVTLKRGRDDQDKDEEPSTGSNRGINQRRSGKEESQPKSSGKSGQAEEHGLRVDNLEEPLHQEFNTGNDDISHSVVELEYHLEEVFKATNDQLACYNPEGIPYPHDLSKPLPLIVILFDHFINNDLEYLKRGSLSQKYTTSLTKTKAADYGHVKWIENKVHRSIWSPAQVIYDKYAYWGTYHWGPKC
ncbi:hypothetical protein Tco_1233330, partial [Tanacetum coccineum]